MNVHNACRMRRLDKLPVETRESLTVREFFQMQGIREIHTLFGMLQRYCHVSAVLNLDRW